MNEWIGVAEEMPDHIPNAHTRKKTNPKGLVFLWWGRTDSFAFLPGGQK